MSSRQLNATAASLLGFLHEGPLTGWDLVAMAEQRIGDFWSLTQSQVYRELTGMATDGLIEAGERGPRDRRPYAITAAGRDAFRQWLARDPDAENIRFPLLLTAMFGRHLPPGRLAEILVRQRAAHADRLRAYEQVAASGELTDPYWRAPLEFGLRYERAALDWFDSLPPELRAG